MVNYVIRVNYANEVRKHLKWDISNNIYNAADMLKRAGIETNLYNETTRLI